MRSSVIRGTSLWFCAAARTTGAIVLALATVSGQGCGGAHPVTSFEEDESRTIAGRVTAVDGSPVVGADVTLEPLAMTTATDGAGRFAFTVASSGSGVSEYLLEVRSDGYETVSLQVIVSSGGSADLTVTLAPVPSGAEPGPEPDSGIVVTSYSDDQVLCIAPGVPLPFTVRISNEGDAPVAGVVLHDTLDTGFSGILDHSDVVVDRGSFPDAAVVLNPDGRSFRVELGTVPPMEAAGVYTVTLPASGAGVFCNHVSAVGGSGALLDSDIGCLTSTLVLEVDVVNEDGSVTGGEFTPEPEVFRVGDGGPQRPDALVYQVLIANHHCGPVGLPLGESSLKSIVGTHAGLVEFREVLPGYPTRGAVVSSTTGGFLWTIGTLAPGEEAEIRFRAEAMQPGEDVHRIELSVPQLVGIKADEEPITILP